jgi:hypothetical protein
VTLDVFVDEEGTASSFHGIGQTIAAKGLFAMLYADRASHYLHTPEAGGEFLSLEPAHEGQHGRASHTSCRRAATINVNFVQPTRSSLRAPALHASC